MQLDLKRMRYIVEAARAEAVTTAAETLGVTQSALSRSIAEVEDELGVKLFHRRARGIGLTQAGERFVENARRILGEVDDLVTDVTSSGEEVTGRLRIGIAPSAFIAYAAPTIREFASEFPKVTIETISGTTQALCPRLLQGELNILVGNSTYLKNWKQIEVEEVRQLFFGAIIRKDHPLAKRNDVKEEDVLAYPVILPETVETMYSDTAQRYAHHGLGPVKPRYVTDDSQLTQWLVETTDAWAPHMNPFPDFGELPKRFRVLEGVVKLPNHTVSLAKASMRETSQLTERFEEVFRERLKNFG